METKRKIKRPWETDSNSNTGAPGAKESVAQILGALSFGRFSSPTPSTTTKNINEDVTSSSTHDEESTHPLDGFLVQHELAETTDSTTKRTTAASPTKSEDQRTIQGKISEIEEDDDDVNSVPEMEDGKTDGAGPARSFSSLERNSTTVAPKSPVREIVRTYETSTRTISGTSSSSTISPVVEELKEMIQEGMVQEKVNVVESLTHQTAAQELAFQEEQKRLRLQAEMEKGRLRALLAAGRLSKERSSASSYESSSSSLEGQALSIPHFDTHDEDVKSVNSLDDDNPVLSVSNDFVEEIIEDHEETIQGETIKDHEEMKPPPDMEQIRRLKLQAEMEEGRRRAAAALQKQKGFNTREQEDGVTIETVASTTKTPLQKSPKRSSDTDLGLQESKSEDSDTKKPSRSPRSIPDEIAEPRFPHIPSSFDQLSESDVLSSALSSTNDTDSFQHNNNANVSPRKRVAEIIRRDLWDKDETIVESALKLLVDKLTHSTDVITFRNAIARNGGILAIVRAMEQHVEHAGIQIVACRALEQLALDTENELAIGEVGGVEAILGAMMTHFTQVQVQDAAWSALCNCTCGNACDIMTIDTQGGMSAIVSCMKQHIDHASIQSSAVGTLTNLCWNNEGRLADLVSAGGFSVMAMTLQKHWDNLTVRNETAHAMHVLLGGAALAHQEQQGEPDVIDELVLKECETEEELDEEDYTDEEMHELD